VSVTGVRVSTEQRFDSVLIRGFNCLPELSNTHTQLGLVVYDPLCQSVKTATKTLTVIATTTTTAAAAAANTSMTIDNDYYYNKKAAAATAATTTTTTTKTTSSSNSYHDRQIPNFARPSTLFPKQFKDFLRFLKLKDFQSWP